MITTPRHAFVVKIAIIIKLFESIVTHKRGLTAALGATVSIDTLFVRLANIWLNYDLSYVYRGVDVIQISNHRAYLVELFIIINKVQCASVLIHLTIHL